MVPGKHSSEARDQTARRSRYQGFAPRFSLLEESLLSVLSGRWLTTCHTGEAAACQANVDRIGLY